MPRRSGIKWRETDKTKLAKSVRKFNAKRTRLIKQVPELEDILPKKAVVTDIKSKISTRQEFNNELNALERFMKKGAEKSVTTKSGVVTTRYQLNELKIQHQQINRLRARELKKANVSTAKGTMGSIQTRHLTPKRNNAQSIPRERWEEYLQSVEQQTHQYYYDKRQKLYQQNYIDALFGELITYSFGDEDFDEINAKLYKIVDMVDSLPPEIVYQAYYQDDDLQIGFIYSSEEAEVRLNIIYEKWLNIWEEYNK